MSKTNRNGLVPLESILSQYGGEVNWSTTPLGSPASWPEALKLSMGILLFSPLPKVICWGPDLLCVYNHAFIDFLKRRYSGDISPGFPLAETLPTVYKKLAPSIDNILEQAEVTNSQAIYINKAEHTVFPEGAYNILCNAIFETGERIGGVLLTFRDSEAKEGLPPGEPNRFEDIFSLVNVGIAQVQCDDMKVSSVNAVFTEYAGKPASFFINKTLAELFPGKLDFFLSVFDLVQDTRKAVRRNEVPVHFSRNNEPVELYLNLVFYPVSNADNIIESVMVIATDETAIVLHRRQANEREQIFSKIVSQSRMGFVILKGETFVIEYANDMVFRTLWHLEPGKAIGKPLFELFPELESQQYAQQLRDVFHLKKSFTEKKSHVFINSGAGLQEFYLDYEYAPIINDEEVVTGVSVNVYDVTNEAMLEIRQQEAQELLQLSLEITGLAHWELLPSGEVIHTGKLLQIFGCGPEAILTRDKIKSLHHPADLKLLEDAINEALATGQYHYDARIIKQDGSLAYIRVRGKAIFDADNKLSKIIGTTLDITQEQNLQKELIRKEQRLRQLILQAPVAIGILRGADYKVEIINEVAKNLLGRTSKQLLGLPILEVMNEVNTTEAKYLLDKVFYDGETVSAKEYPVKILRKGRMVKIFVNFEYDPVRNEQNEVIGVMVVGTEVTDQVIARKKIEASEEQFRLLANSVPHLVWMSDEEGHLLFANKVLEAYSGKSAEILSSEGIINIFHPEEAERIQAKWQRAIKSSTEFIDEHRIASWDGQYRWYLTRGMPIRNEGERTQYWIATSTDIQEIKEQDFQKDYFISRASHELKTPITSLKGYVQILRNVYENSPEPLLTTSLQRMETQINKLTKLIEELLDTTRLNSNGIQLEKEKTDLVSLLRETIDDIATAYPDYKFEFKSTAIPTVAFDKNRISQVMNNLLTNAVKYSPSVKTILVDASLEGDMARVSVTDQGIGIGRSYLKNIFEKFYRVTGKNEDTFPGFGIGLYLVNEIVKRHGGYVTVESELGEGSTFSFFIPLG